MVRHVFSLTGLLLLATGFAAEPAPEVRGAIERLQKFANEEKAPARRKIYFVYFTPADREPPSDCRERLGRMMRDVQEFYAREMQRHGFGPRTIQLDQDDRGALNLHFVKGKHPAAYYLGRDTAKGYEIRQDARPVLAAAGIDDRKETVVCFCHVRTEKDGKVTGIGPYYGSGSFRHGWCWFTDASILDPLRLNDKTTMLDDEEYHRISVGRYNSIFIGGAAHELGHALGLSHNRERQEERSRGKSLMGSGNRTYGEERRGDGPGSFLTLADALRLASHPMFSGTTRGLELESICRLEELRVEARGGFLDISGRVVAAPTPYAVIAYNDPEGGDDYDATAWTAPLDAADRFTVRVGELKPGTAELRLVVCHVNGAVSWFRYPFRVSADGTPDTSTFVIPVALRDAFRAWADGRLQETRQLALATTNSPMVRPWAVVLADIAGPEPAWPSLADVTTNTVSLGRVQWSEARVGWSKPARNHFPRAVGPELPFLCLGGRYVTDGLYAHAPSQYVFELGGRWKTFTAEVGLQAGGFGSVVFVVRADGRERFRSKLLKRDATARVSVDVAGVKRLELITENGGDGNQGDWGIWANPVLAR